MSSLIAFFLVVLVPLCLGHAGFSSPDPRKVCNANSPISDCGLTIPPCGGIPYSPPQKAYPSGTKMAFTVYQLFAHYNSTSQNTYYFNVYSVDASNTMTLRNSESFSQTQFSTQDRTTFDIKSADYALPTTPGIYTFQLIFNATSGGGVPYYSCIDLEIRSGASYAFSASHLTLILLLILVSSLFN